MLHVFICGVYSGARRVRQKIWTPLFSHKIKNKNSITSLLEEKERKQSY